MVALASNLLYSSWLEAPEKCLNASLSSTVLLFISTGKAGQRRVAAWDGFSFMYRLTQGELSSHHNAPC